MMKKFRFCGESDAIGYRSSRSVLAELFIMTIFSVCARGLWLLAIGFIVVLAIAGCSRTAENAATREITLAAFVDQTGSSASPTHKQAVELAIQQMNHALALSTGALSNVKFVVKIFDSRNDPAVTASGAQEVVLDGGAKGLIIDTSASTTAVNKAQYDDDATNDLNVPIVCTSCTASTINNPEALSSDAVEQAALRNEKKWVWKTTASTRVLGRVLAKELVSRGTHGDVNNDGKFKIAIIQVDDAFGRSVTADIKAALADLAPNAIVEAVIHPRELPAGFDWDTEWKKASDDASGRADGGVIADGVPDVATIASFPAQLADATAIWQQNHTAYVPLVQWNSFRIRSVLDTLSSKAEGQEGISFLPYENTTSGTQFAADFETEYGLEPALRDGFFYDGTIVLMLAALMEQLETPEGSQLDPTGINEKLTKTSQPTGTTVGAGLAGLKTAINAIAEKQAINFEGSTGPMDFDVNAAVKNRLTKFKVENGVFKNGDIFDCVKSDACDVQP